MTLTRPIRQQIKLNENRAKYKVIIKTKLSVLNALPQDFFIFF